jgi:single-strand DNA-binding protein
MSGFTINRVVLIGRLTKDPELRTLPSGSSVCNLRVACNASRSDGEGGYREKPNYFDVSAFAGAAENVSRHTRKGSRVAIDGRLEWREWETAEQQKRQAVNVIADTIMFLDGAGERPGTDRPRDDEPRGGFGGEADEDEGSAGELVGVGAEDDDLIF